MFIVIFLFLFTVCSNNLYAEDLKGECNDVIKENNEIKEGVKLAKDICMTNKTVKRMLCNLDKSQIFNSGAMGSNDKINAGMPMGYTAITLNWYGDGVVACRVVFGEVTGLADITDTFPNGTMNFDDSDKASYQYDTDAKVLYIKQKGGDNDAEVLKMNCKPISE